MVKIIKMFMYTHTHQKTISSTVFWKNTWNVIFKESRKDLEMTKNGWGNIAMLISSNVQVFLERWNGYILVSRTRKSFINLT